tara:strand:+ start:9044 stop:10057 length:1014 start_codon:yes stop_codon:yes gene_type:complete
MTSKKALITGISGQDGAYLAKYLLSKDYQVFGIERRTASNENFRLKYLEINDKVNMLRVDLCEFISITKIIQEHRFDEIYNLAAQSFVGSSWDNPISTSNINSIAVTNILDSIYRFSPETKFYQASTSEMFGEIKEERQSEDTPFHPRSPYGVSKLYAHWMTQNYRESYNLFCCSGILFNHESPLRGSEFVTKKITSTLCAQSKGHDRVLKLGNIDAKRDWGFAGDYIEAMYMMLQSDEPQDFVIGTGITHSVRDFCNMCLEELKIDYIWKGSGLDEKCIKKDDNKVIIEISEEFFRPAEVDILLANPAKAIKVLGWKAKTDLRALVKMMIEYDLSK